MNIRPETAADATAITGVVERAFAGHPHSRQTEAGIVRGLRAAGALTVSLVAEQDGAVVGHIAFSPVAAGRPDWYGLGPLAVDPRWQSQGIGAQLVNAGLARLRRLAAAGCVVVGEPAYYGRFGFRAASPLVLNGVPPEYFMALPLDGHPCPHGEVAYHPAFSSSG